VAKVKLLDPSDPRRRLDRYELIGEIATGGMATVFLARRGGAGGFQRFAAIKRLHPHLANEPEFVEMFLDEARLAALIHHPNVVPILEVGENEAGYYLVMEYVEGDTLARIVARTMSMGQLPPRQIILRIILDALAGLHAAHELRDDRGQLLGLVHRDVSPQNVLVGVDGTARITDFGVARASARLTSTAHGKLKGKLAYMAPEQTRGDELDRRTDLFAMGIILWEVLCGRRLFKADSEAATLQRILVEPIRPPSELVGSVPSVFDAVSLRALDRDPSRRFQTAADFADAIELAAREGAKQSVTDVGIASPREVAGFVTAVLGNEIGAQRESVRAWLAQSDSGQPVVIQGSPPAPPSPRRGGGTAPMLTDRSDAMDSHPDARELAAAHARMPETVREGGSAPPAGSAEALRYAPRPGALAPAAVPQLEVSADVTMRFALDQPKPAAPPRAAPPPPRNGPPSDPPPPSKPPSSSRRGPKPPEPPPPSSRRPPRVGPPPPPSQPTLLGQGPPPTPPPEVLDQAAAALAYSAQVSDDLGDDAPTLARGGSSAPPPPVETAVKTQRGLFAQPLLAAAQAEAAKNGAAVDASAAGSVPRTPRMPMPADDLAHAPPPGSIVEAVPVASATGAAGRQMPRTLVSAQPTPGGEVSTGGFTPGSMTLGLHAHGPSSTTDPTVVHQVPKRGVGKYVVVFAAFLLVFGTGLLLLKSREASQSTPASTAAKPKEKEREKEPVPPPIPASSTEAVSTQEPTAPASSEPANGEPTGRRQGPRPPRVRTTATATAKPTAEPTSPPKPPPSGESLDNPYR
jgi:serine/threonine-protein kinase